VLLAGRAPSSCILYHALSQAFPDLHVVAEDRPSTIGLLRRRVRRLGPLTVLGQALFVGVVVPVLRILGEERIEAIKHEFSLDDSQIDRTVHRVTSVNAPEARTVLRCLKPAVVVVGGTRIIDRETLQAVDAPFINMHAGITPRYRGVHGGYWALTEGQPDLVGTTVHFVDEGIDTGKIIAQRTFAVTHEDSFVTYPYLHAAAGLPSLIAAVRAVLEGTPPEGYSRDDLSRLRSHPTLWGYLWRRAARRIR